MTMKNTLYLYLFMFCFLSYGEDDQFKNLSEKSVPSLTLDALGDLSPSLAVVQGRFVPKKHLSELSLGTSATVKGVVYSHSGSFDLSYRFHFNNYWSAGFQYSWFWNERNEEGDSLIKKFNRVPLNLKYARKQSVRFLIDWYPFYAKAVVWNKVIHFDIYTTLHFGSLELILKNKVPYGGLASGFVFWLSQKCNVRIELNQTLYAYNLDKEIKEKGEFEKEFLTNAFVSIGWLF